LGGMVINEKEKLIRIVILLGAPFTEQNFERVGIPYLSKHFEVMVFDCTVWLGRNTENIKFQMVDWHNFLTIKSEIDLALQIEKYRPHYAIDSIDHHVTHTDKILNILEEFMVRFVVVKSGSLPGLSLKSRIKNTFFGLSSKSIRVDSQVETNARKELTSHTDLSSHTDLYRVATKMLYKLWDYFKRYLAYRRLNRFRPFIGLLAGNKSLNHYTRNSNPIIWIGSNDYHTFKKAKSALEVNGALQLNEPFILFIDDNLPNASDWTLLGIQPPVTASLYYPALTTFFAKIEAIYDMPVKIAGHPNSLTDRNFQFNMGGRSIIFGDTAALALQSSLVLVHGSTATSFAVLARKPTLFLTTQELDRSTYGLHVRTMANSLGSRIIFIDQPVEQTTDIETILINDRKYKNYVENYIRNHQSSEDAPWMAFIEFINKNRYV
jgi:hypothetical protein